jgi:hypothetical protein
MNRMAARPGPGPFGGCGPCGPKCMFAGNKARELDYRSQKFPNIHRHAY